MATVASAAGKAILLGEHAVVYGRPAIAVPVSDVRASAQVRPLVEGEGVVFWAADLGQRFTLREPGAADAAPALCATVRNTLAHLGIPSESAHFEVHIRSDIPVARGMGSGTAVATALVRAVSRFYGHDLAVSDVSDLVYRTEVLLHGTPSGVDNTVVAHERPVYFAKGRPFSALGVPAPLHLLIADTGIPSRTHDTVAAVRQRWQADRVAIEALFDRVGAAVDEARDAIAGADLPLLGRLMSHNHTLLQQLGVSCAELDRLVGAALGAGALGAKLSGGGGGGCMVALVGEASEASAVRLALGQAGAAKILETIVRAAP